MGELVYKLYDKQMRKLIEKFVTHSGKMLFDLIHAIEQFKLGRASEIALEMLDEADALMDDITWRVAMKPFDKFAHTVRELLQVIRSQVIFIDQYRQSHFAF
jgi:hypothetical protein